MNAVHGAELTHPTHKKQSNAESQCREAAIRRDEDRERREIAQDGVPARTAAPSKRTWRNKFLRERSDSQSAKFLLHHAIALAHVGF